MNRLWRFIRLLLFPANYLYQAQCYFDNGGDRLSVEFNIDGNVYQSDIRQRSVFDWIVALWETNPVIDNFEFANLGLPRHQVRVKDVSELPLFEKE